jgi:hypothetical protein
MDLAPAIRRLVFWKTRMEVPMLEFCASSYLIMMVFAALFLWSALGVAKRAGRMQHGLVFWSELAAARRTGRFPYDMDQMD